MAISFQSFRVTATLHVLKGCFELTFADGRQFPAMEGDTLLVPAHTSHKDIFEQRRDLKILTLHFDWTEAEKFFAEVKNEKINRMRFPSLMVLRLNHSAEAGRNQGG